MKYLKSIVLLVSITTVASLSLLVLKDPVNRSQLLGFSLSSGDRYYHRLQLWYRLARSGDWANASRVEKHLDTVDIAAYRSAHQPEELKKLINSLVLKPNKSVEDWLELARIQSLVGKDKDAAASVAQAHQMDPVREDITKLYYQLNK